MWPKTISWPNLKLSIVGYPPTPAPSHRPSRKLNGAMAGCSSGSPLSVMRASPDHLERRVSGGDGDHSVGEDHDGRAQHPVHSASLVGGARFVPFGTPGAKVLTWHGLL